MTLVGHLRRSWDRDDASSLARMREEFIRWAVGAERAYRLPGFPGCSNGFNAIAGKLAWVAQQTTAGEAVIQRIPIKSVVEAAMQMIQDDPYALLCDDLTCERCNAIRER